MSTYTRESLVEPTPKIPDRAAASTATARNQRGLTRAPPKSTASLSNGPQRTLLPVRNTTRTVQPGAGTVTANTANGTHKPARVASHEKRFNTTARATATGVQKERITSASTTPSARPASYTNGNASTSTTLDTTIRSQSTRPTPKTALHPRSRSLASNPATPQRTPTSIRDSASVRSAQASRQTRPTPLKSHQQGITPRKATITSKAANPTSQSHATALPLAIARQQAELLQLEILVEAAPATYDAWLESAKQKLQARYEKLVAEYQESRQSELDLQQYANLLAMREWSPHPNPVVLQKKLTRLITILTELYVLTDPIEGDYTRLIEKVEQWTQWVQSVWTARDAGENAVSSSSNDNNNNSSRSGLAEGLGDAMKSDLNAFTELVNQYVPELQTMHNPSPTPGSSTAVLLNACTTMTRQMQEELQMLREIEFEVAVGERTWIQEQVEKISGSIDGNF